MKTLLGAIIFLSLAGCASGDGRDQSSTNPGMRDYDWESKARGPAYVTDQFNVRKPIRDSSDWEPMNFYHKHCSKMGSPEVRFPNRINYECDAVF